VLEIGKWLTSAIVWPIDRLGGFGKGPLGDRDRNARRLDVCAGAGITALPWGSGCSTSSTSAMRRLRFPD